MYEDLIKRLRNVSIELGQLDHVSVLLLEAADAIEELQKAVYFHKYNSEFWEDKYNSLVDEKWISVTERLPESGVHVLACCRVKWLGGGGRNYVCDAFYSAPKAVICSYNDDIEAEYDEDTDEYYMPEGWWEVIKNWDDYSCVAIADFVTHWMPLPQPPKESNQ